MRQARELGLGVGLAFNPGTAVADAVAASAGADLVLCMSIVPGYSGQPFMPEALDRIRELRAALPPEVHVQVDGGIGMRDDRPGARGRREPPRRGQRDLRRCPTRAVAYRQLA